jgi:superfamily II DNA or RNA helicase
VTTTIVVDNRIRVPTEGIDAETVSQLKKACEHANPEFAKKRAMGYATYNVPAILKTWKETRTEISLPRGAMKRARKILKAQGVETRVVDRRTEGSILTRPLRYVGHEVRTYQREAAILALAREQGVIRAATGSGKTTTAIWLAALTGLNTLIILPSVKLLDQTVEVTEQLLGLKGTQIGIVQASTRRLRPVTVATQQTLWSRGVDAELKEFFGTVIVDEAHHAAARTFGESIDEFPARYRFAFTADERRKDRMEFLVYDAFGDVLHETGRETCEASGAVVDVEVRIVPTDFAAPWYREEQDFNRLLDEMTLDEERNGICVDLAREELAAGEQVIVLSHRRDHVRELDRVLSSRGIRSGCMLGGQDAADEQEFEATRAGLRSGHVRAGVGTYGALGEGIDLPAVAVGIATTPIASNRQKFNQVRGRLCRPSQGKTQGRLYVPFDRRVFDERMLNNIFSWNRTVKIKRGGSWVDARPHRRAIMRA